MTLFILLVKKQIIETISEKMLRIFFFSFFVTDAFLRDLFWSNNDETSELAHELADAKKLISDLRQESQELKNVMNEQKTQLSASILANERAIQEIKEEFERKAKLHNL